MWRKRLRARYRDILQREVYRPRNNAVMHAMHDVLADADDKLFESILANSEHILHNYIPEPARPSHHHHHLRPRKHSKELIHKTRKLNDKDFIVRMLYKDMY